MAAEEVGIRGSCRPARGDPHQGIRHDGDSSYVDIPLDSSYPPLSSSAITTGEEMRGGLGRPTTILRRFHHNFDYLTLSRFYIYTLVAVEDLVVVLYS